jgi:hypothetical protein
MFSIPIAYSTVAFNEFSVHENLELPLDPCKCALRSDHLSQILPWASILENQAGKAIHTLRAVRFAEGEVLDAELRVLH